MKNIEKVKEQLINNEIENLFEGFDVNSFDKYGNNILHYYIKNGEIIIDSQLFINMLIDKGFDINMVQSKSPKCSPLHLAVKLKKHKIVEILIKLNANIDIVDENGNTPLSDAVFGYKNDDSFFIDFLIAHGADKNILNNYGVSPLILANTIANYDSKSLLK